MADRWKEWESEEDEFDKTISAFSMNDTAGSRPLPREKEPGEDAGTAEEEEAPEKMLWGSDFGSEEDEFDKTVSAFDRGPGGQKKRVRTTKEEKTRWDSAEEKQEEPRKIKILRVVIWVWMIATSICVVVIVPFASPAVIVYIGVIVLFERWRKKRFR